MQKNYAFAFFRGKSITSVPISIKRIYIFFLLLSIAINAYPITSIDSLRQVLKENTLPAEKSKIHQQIAQYWAREQQQDSVKAHINAMLALAEQEKSTLLLEYLSNANKLFISIGDFNSAEQLNNKYLKKFGDKNDPPGMAVCYNNLGRIQLFTGHISEAGKLLRKAYKLSEGNRALRAAISIDLGGVYNRQSHYTDALQILTDALATTDSVKDVKNYCGLLFTIGNTYGQINDHQTGLGYFQRVLTLCKKSGDIMGEANALTNIATANSNLKNYAIAEDYAKEALAIVSNKNLMAEADVLSVLTDVLLKQHKYNELETHYNRMYQIGKTTGNDFYTYLADIGMAHIASHNKNYNQAIVLLTQSLPQLEAQGDWNETIQGYELLYESYNNIGDYKNALASAVKHYSYKDSASNQDKVKELALLQSKLIFQKKELVHEKEQRIKNIIIISLSAIFLLAVLLAVFIFKNRQKLHKQKQLLLSSQLERAEHHLKLSESQLNDFALRIQQKSKLIEDLEGKLASQPNANNILLTQLQQSIILTEDDWLNFKTLFEQVHSGFLHRLKEKYPDISPAEIRYLTLVKLHFTTKEMAAALGVSTQSIRTNWYRIRKKLDLPDALTAEELISKI